jgi:hypothetical protein
MQKSSVMVSCDGLFFREFNSKTHLHLTRQISKWWWVMMSWFFINLTTNLTSKFATAASDGYFTPAAISKAERNWTTPPPHHHERRCPGSNPSWRYGTSCFSQWNVLDDFQCKWDRSIKVSCVGIVYCSNRITHISSA